MVLKNWPRFLLICLTCWLLFNPYYLFKSKPGWDDASYLAHAYTIGLDGDLDYCNEMSFDTTGCAGKALRTAPPHPVGAGILHAPLTGLFGLADRMLNHSVVGQRREVVLSWSFFGFFLSASCFFLIGCACYVRSFALLKIDIPAWMIVLLAASVGIPVYVLQRFTMAHAAEFMVLALIVWTGCSLLLSNGKKSIGLLVLLPVWIGLSYLIRPSNINVLLLPPILYLMLTEWGQVKLRFSPERKHIGVLLGSTVLVLFAIMWLNSTLYQHPFPSSTQLYGFRIARIPGNLQGKIEKIVGSLPHLPDLFFSSEYGLLFSAPLLLIGSLFLISLIALQKWSFRSLVLTLLTLTFLAIPLSVVLLWRNTGDAYGYRYLFSLTPLCLLVYGIIIKKLRPFQRGALQYLMTTLALISLTGQVFYMTSAELTPGKRINAFGKMERFSAMGYETALINSITSVTGWKDMAARRFPGFVAMCLMPEEKVRGLAESGSNKEGRFSELYGNISRAPLSYILAILLFGLAFPYTLYRLITGDRISPEIHAVSDEKTLE